MLPLRRYADCGALVIGSLVPDFGYFFDLPVPRYYTHSVLGLFISCLPLGVITYAGYCTLLRQPLLDLAPEGLRRRLPESAPLPGTTREWLAIANAILIGALLHLLWDEFTHTSWRQGQIFPWMRNVVFRLGDQPVRLLDLAYHGSTVLGLGLITGCSLRWWRRTPAMTSVAPTRRMTPLGRSLVLSGAFVFILASVISSTDDVSRSLGQLRGEIPLTRGAGAGLRALTAALIAYCLGWQILRRLASRLTPSS